MVWRSFGSLYSSNHFSMEIPMFYMYGLMPLCGVICAVCIVIKAVEAVFAPVSAFEPVDK